MNDKQRMCRRGFFCFLLLLFLVSCNGRSTDWQQREAFLMDTMVRVRVLANESVLDDVFLRLQEIDAQFNRHSENSDISKINQKAGVSSVEVSEEVYRLLSRAMDYCRQTNGAFNPAIGVLSDLWRIEGSGTERTAIPSEQEIQQALEYCDPSSVELKDGTVFIHTNGVVLDLGGIVKGYAADQIVEILKQRKVSAAVIDLGGNIYVYGEKPDGSAWKIGIADPFTEEHREAFVLNTQAFSCVTSGDYERYFTYRGEKYHHIFDTKTGYPARNGLVSVSVLSKNSEQADVLSTACFVLGEKEALELLKPLKVEAVFITETKEIHAMGDIFEKIEKESVKDDFSLKRVE